MALKATALDGSEKTIGQCVAANGTFTCTVTENVAEVLGGNGSIKNGFVKLEATLTKASIGKTTTDVVVDGTKHTVSLGKGGCRRGSHPRRPQVLLLSRNDPGRPVRVHVLAPGPGKPR